MANPYDVYKKGAGRPTDPNGNWSVGGLGGKGQPGSLGKWDAIGNGLDKANPSQQVDTKDDEAHAQSSLDQAQNAYSGMSAPTLDRITGKPIQGSAVQQTSAAAAHQGPSNFGGIKVNPQYNEQQMSQMAALSNLAKNGGRSAASDANLAQIQNQENTNARGQRDAIMANMRARGQGNSGNALLAQLSSSQNATNNQSMQDLGVQANQQNAALQAGMGASQIGAGMHAQDYGEQANLAQSQDAIDRFNAGNDQTTSVFNAGQANDLGRFNSSQDFSGQQFNSGQDFAGQQFNSGLGQSEFADQMGINAGNQAGGKIGVDYWGNKYKEDQQTKAGVLGGVMKIGGGLMGAATGGRVPGTAHVHGNSIANDKVPVMTSPGEVIIPRTLAHTGSKEDIHSFVKHPPQINDKEAILSALKNLRRRH